jgi:hypothetical protein
MHPPDYNLSLADAMLDELEPYLLSTELFWPLEQRVARGMPRYPRLTLGGLLLTIDELSAQEEKMTSSQAAALLQIRSLFAHNQVRWEVGIERKTVRELHCRLNLWRAYLTDLEEKKEGPENYTHEVRQRVMFQRLLDLASKHPEIEPLNASIQSLDLKLRANFTTGLFIWDKRLESVYSPPVFWHLYGTPNPIRKT